MLRQFLKSLDVRVGRHFDLMLPAYIEEKRVPDAEGAYTAEEWARVRHGGYRGLEEGAMPPTEAEYQAYIVRHHAAAVASATRLASEIDFTRYHRLLELGCGEMAQAYTLKRLRPAVNYLATDFDPSVIARCGTAPYLGSVEKAVVDATRLNAGEIAAYDLIASWEMFYALEDDQIRNLFGTAAAAGVPILVATTQLTGPMRQGLRALKGLHWSNRGSRYDQLVKAKRIRRHGWNPSIGHYAALAEAAGLRLSRIWAPPLRAPDDNFFHLLFERKRP